MQFENGMQARVQRDGEYCEPFTVSNRVKQGWVMALTLFSMMFPAMLTDTLRTVMLVFLSGTTLMTNYSI